MIKLGMVCDLNLLLSLPALNGLLLYPYELITKVYSSWSSDIESRWKDFPWRHVEIGTSGTWCQEMLSISKELWWSRDGEKEGIGKGDVRSVIVQVILICIIPSIVEEGGWYEFIIILKCNKNHLQKIHIHHLQITKVRWVFRKCDPYRKGRRKHIWMDWEKTKLKREFSNCVGLKGR